MGGLKYTSTDPDTIWLCRVNGLTGRCWLVYSERNVMRGKPGESRDQLLRRWIETNGKPGQLIRYKGICRPAEAAAAMAQDMIHVSESGTMGDES